MGESSHGQGASFRQRDRSFQDDIEAWEDQTSTLLEAYCTVTKRLSKFNKGINLAVDLTTSNVDNTFWDT